VTSAPLPCFCFGTQVRYHPLPCCVFGTQVAKVELIQECDYERELESQDLFAQKLREYEGKWGGEWGQGGRGRGRRGQVGSECTCRGCTRSCPRRRVITTEFVWGESGDANVGEGKEREE